MKQERRTYIQNILLPCLLFSGIAGAFTGLFVFLFRMAATEIIRLSEELFAWIREAPQYLPLLLLGAAALGLLTALILRRAKSCRGGGIPTAVALLRGLITFRWVNSIFVLFTTAMFSFLGGLPLGSEGPCVQMGTAVGSGTVRIFARRHPAWERYIMTGGACAGFATATGAPITGIFFAFEEAHRRFSPMLFMTAASAVLTGTVTTRFLCSLSGMQFSMFEMPTIPALPMTLLWFPLVIGAVSALFAILFTKCYRLIGALINKTLSRVPFVIKLTAVFVLVAFLGFFFSELTGSGHHIIHTLLFGRGVWYLLLAILILRAILLLLSNHAGATGGLFVPSLCFGALIGALCAELFVAIGILPVEFYALSVIIGMASFLAASARTPITALTFAAEALCGFSGILPVMIGVTLSFLVIETAGITSFNDTVIESKVAAAREGKTPQVVETHLSVRPGAFVIGKEVRDILWPPSCVILSVQNAPDRHLHGEGMAEGDILHVRYQTYDPAHTARLLSDLIGDSAPAERTFRVTDDHHLPDI